MLGQALKTRYSVNRLDNDLDCPGLEERICVVHDLPASGVGRGGWLSEREKRHGLHRLRKLEPWFWPQLLTRHVERQK